MYIYIYMHIFKYIYIYISSYIYTYTYVYLDIMHKIIGCHGKVLMNVDDLLVIRITLPFSMAHCSVTESHAANIKHPLIGPF